MIDKYSRKGQKMNKNIAKPLIIQFTPPETHPKMQKTQKSIFIPVNTTWEQFKENVIPLVSDQAYDSVLVHVTNKVDRDMKGVVGNIAVKMNTLASAGTKVNKPVLTYETPDEPFYLMNPEKDDMKKAGLYAPSDETIMEKYNRFESDDAWQEYQDKIWSRMKDMMPLSRKADKYNYNHAEQLKDPKRGLEDKDLRKFWSFKSRQGLSPALMGDDMVGMPSVEGREYEGFTMSVNQPDGTVKIKPLQVRSLMTVGMTGIMIPMANANGHVNKHQVATDLTPFTTVLHFRAKDGKTVAKGEIFDKNTKEYSFKFANGEDTHLKVTSVSSDNTITMQDTHGIFNIKPKNEIIDMLKDRGYVVPDIITSVKAEQNGKYMWQSPGTMTGSEEVLKTVSPSNPGFIKAREPKNGEKEYVVLVAEGALKGHIVAKYVDVKDKEGICFGDKIAGDKGIIVTQVPGVAESYVKNAVSIYDKYPIAETYIAMDADGRENRNVALGIHSAHECINRKNKTSVLSWDPAQKGMDDALLAVAQGKITIEEMGIVQGLPDQLFPLENAQKMTPYTLDGKQKSQPSWMLEYEEDKKERKAKIAAAQEETAKRTDKKQENQWMGTPDDIDNIQSVTIAKSAEMADAIAGTMPQAKVEPKVTHTPDADEILTGNIATEKKPETVVKTEQTMENPLNKEAKEWDLDHPAMPSMNVPDGYKSTYQYEQPVMFDKIIYLPLSDDSKFTFMGDDKNRWGIVSIETQYEMSAEEKKERQNGYIESGASCIGNMRLTSQSFTLDQEMNIHLSADDLPERESGPQL